MKYLNTIVGSAVALLAACGDAHPTSGDATVVASLAIVVPNSTIEPFDVVTPALVLRDAQGRPVDATAPVSWSSSDSSVATIQMESRGASIDTWEPGDVTLRATVQGVSASILVHVAWKPDTRLVIAGAGKMAVGDQSRLSTTAGRSVPVERVVWQSSDSRIVDISQPGAITAVAPGTATVVARVGGLSDSVAVTVVPFGPTYPAVVMALGEVRQLGPDPASAGGEFAASHWVCDRPDVLELYPTGVAVATKPGSAVIRSDKNGPIIMVVNVEEPQAVGASQALIVQKFSMIAYEYPSQPGHTYYAPQVRVIAASGRSVTIISLTAGLTDWGGVPPVACGAEISDDRARDLNGVVYGDWAFSVDSPRPAGTTEALLTLTFVDDTGTMATLTVAGDVVRGSLPATYSGPTGACFHGYGATG